MKSKINCFFGKHNWSGADNNTCSICGKIAIGLPKFVNPPEPPENGSFDTLNGKLQIPPVKNPLPPPNFRPKLE